MFDIADQHILVTGGFSHFGRHFARFLASNGAKVTLAARRAEALASVVAEISAAGGNADTRQHGVAAMLSNEQLRLGRRAPSPRLVLALRQACM